MDRRKRKTREAIFSAFVELLSKKEVNQITIGEIIERADVGRATFYAHFETKDYLLNALCEELFCHIFDCTKKGAANHKHIFDCDAPDSVFLHLFKHVQKNDNHILDLFSCQNNELFLRCFKNGLIDLIQKEYTVFEKGKKEGVPHSFWVNHIATTFVQTIWWWVENDKQETPEQITNYFLSVLNISV